MTAEKGGSSPRSSAERLWRFSLAVYGRPGVADACLALQDRHGLDVNLLLWCCWHASEGRALGAADVTAAEARVSSWRATVVEPLRAVRRQLKRSIAEWPTADVEQLRAATKGAELEAERLEQVMLAAVSAGEPNAGSTLALAAGSIRRYLALRRVQPDEADGGDVEAIITASEECR
jgi:uncharacterized protein (TIGR02444 family)